MRARLASHCHIAGNVFFALAFSFSVFAFGATTVGTMWFSHLLLCGAVVCFFLRRIFAGSLSQLFRPGLLPVWIPVFWLMGQGLWMVLNAASTHSMLTGIFQPLAPWFSEALPGSIVQEASRNSWWLQSVLLLFVWCLAVECRRQSRLLFAARTLGVVGLCFSIAGLLQSALGVNSIYGMFEERHRFFFGSYRYHGNAGTFILMAWPFCTALFFREIMIRKPKPVQGILWGCGSLLLFVSLLINVSRAAQVIGCVTVGVFLMLNWRIIMSACRRHLRSRHKQNTKWILVLAASAAMFIGVGFFQSLVRWNDFFTSKYWPPTNTVRWQAYVIEAGMVKDAGWMGFGPGTFKHIFPVYNEKAEVPVEGVWHQAHQDYIQTWIEWGALGALAWGGILLGSLAVCIWALFLRKKSFPQSRHLMVSAALTSMLGFYLHALVDFPFQIYSLQLFLMICVAMGWSCLLVSTRHKSPQEEGGS